MHAMRRVGLYKLQAAAAARGKGGAGRRAAANCKLVYCKLLD